MSVKQSILRAFSASAGPANAEAGPANAEAGPAKAEAGLANAVASLAKAEAGPANAKASLAKAGTASKFPLLKDLIDDAERSNATAGVGHRALAFGVPLVYDVSEMFVARKTTSTTQQTHDLAIVGMKIVLGGSLNRLVFAGGLVVCGGSVARTALGVGTEGCDIDIYCIGIDVEEGRRRIVEALGDKVVRVCYTTNCDTYLTKSKLIQLVHKSFASIHELLTQFDVPLSQVAYTGSEIVFTAVGALSHNLKMIWPDKRRLGSLMHQKRLCKYYNMVGALALAMENPFGNGNGSVHIGKSSASNGCLKIEKNGNRSLVSQCRLCAGPNVLEPGYDAPTQAVKVPVPGMKRLTFPENYGSTWNLTKVDEWNFAQILAGNPNGVIRYIEMTTPQHNWSQFRYLRYRVHKILKSLELTDLRRLVGTEIAAAAAVEYTRQVEAGKSADKAAAEIVSTIFDPERLGAAHTSPYPDLMGEFYTGPPTTVEEFYRIVKSCSK